MLRFVHYFSYADGTSPEGGETWFRQAHVRTVAGLRGVVKYVSWPAEPLAPLPSPDKYDRFVRRADLYFTDIDTLIGGTLERTDIWRSATKGPGFGEFECMCLEEEPQYDIMRDVPPQQYKYMQVPLKYTGPTPEFEDSVDVVYDSYFFSYGPTVPIPEGEDWYLGHHVREAKLLKQVGRRHYKTWKAVRVPEKPDSLLQINKWYRMTELGLSLPTRYFSNAGPEGPKIEMTRPPKGIFGSWRNIIIRPEKAEDLSWQVTVKSIIGIAQRDRDIKYELGNKYPLCSALFIAQANAESGRNMTNYPATAQGTAPSSDRRKQIIERALSLFVTRGYMQTTMSEIAAACGMSKGNFYNYFHSKEDLVYAIRELTVEQFNHDLAELESRIMDLGPLGALKLYIDLYVRSVDRWQDAYNFLNHIVVQLDKEGRKVLLKGSADVQITFERILTAAVEAGAISPCNVTLVAHNVAHLCSAWAHNRWRLRKLMNLDEYIKQQTEFIMNAIKPCTS